MVSFRPPLDSTPLAVRLESKRYTHDGAIWPRARQDMVCAEPIKDRMVEDLQDIIRQAGEFHSVCDDALIARGWTPEQVRRYGQAAARHINRENACGNDETTFAGVV